jgi:hypothetical protein
MARVPPSLANIVRTNKGLPCVKVAEFVVLSRLDDGAPALPEKNFLFSL